MSEVNIEQKETGGVPWWAWLLGALVLGALIWFATSTMSGRPADQVAVGADNGALVADADNSAMMADNSAMMADNSAMMADNSAMMADNSAMADTNAAMSNDVSMSGNSTVASAPTGEAITDILSIVDAREPSELYGKTVQLKGAPVQAAGTKVFWIGPSFEQKMLVVTDDSTNMNGINTGVKVEDRVDIEGTLMEISDFNDAKAKYKLDDDAITFLTNKKVLMMASSIKRDKN